MDFHNSTSIYFAPPGGASKNEVFRYLHQIYAVPQIHSYNAGGAAPAGSYPLADVPCVHATLRYDTVRHAVRVSVLRARCVRSVLALLRVRIRLGCACLPRACDLLFKGGRQSAIRFFARTTACKPTRLKLALAREAPCHLIHNQRLWICLLVGDVAAWTTASVS
eukprot:5829402-Pleurochrysis_carterae.AAC.1